MPALRAASAVVVLLELGEGELGVSGADHAVGDAALTGADRRPVVLLTVGDVVMVEILVVQERSDDRAGFEVGEDGLRIAARSNRCRGRRRLGSAAANSAGTGTL